MVVSLILLFVFLACPLYSLLFSLFFFFFSLSQVGLSTCVAVMIHEIPHELGDYAILIQSGFSQSQALKLQFVTAIGTDGI